MAGRKPKLRPIIGQPTDPTIKHIALTQGQIAVVDATDYDWLNQWPWCAAWNQRGKSFYAVRGVWNGHKRERISMHGAILGWVIGDDWVVDHKSGDTLDNRRVNIRRATRIQNQMNMKKRTDNTSGYAGVTFYKPYGKWASYVRHNTKAIFFGYHSTAEQANVVRVEAVKNLRGEFFRTN